ncbi:TatD family nuclease-associated radical SAM protein [Pelotomaculum terephthalicicum JT]|uniref:TatD family nuclease-associated radical SAM protein n=1 Tax=Pelotomaculum TaxID=191373 RepID=UPI0009D4C27F|nr:MULTISPECIES: TatD family nuclease-associated radical SAM protein [Pelotomaculum]MCG9967635.1 TatD family nuclease-associated radical SAM protein [Pelotomaculum terephthalicicum JT]OPX84067.1 MAG: molybdenum cofactor biosynthesis protein A [Pelotomaculum sp. PtaB.Bin117]
MTENVYAYKIGDSLYLNITNKCTNECVFCIRQTSNKLTEYSLWLDKEPDLNELLSAAGDVSRYREVVFCGYGEPLIKADLVIAASRALKERGAAVRIDTNGQADLIHGRDIALELAGSVDAVSISLNASDAMQYVSICRPQMGEKAYWAMLDFIASCKTHIPKVTLSVVRWPGVDIEKCRAIARNLGVEFKVREYFGTFTY